jgi:hypothetical protein
MIHIEFAGFKNSDEILVTNSLGQLVHSARVDGIKTTVKLPGVAGVYFLRYIGEAGEYHTRIVKK